MTPCKFVFDDSPVFEGFAHGSTWNGFDNVAVTPEVHAQIIAHFKAEAEQYGFDYEPMDDIEPMANGLISLGWGYATRIVTDEQTKG